MANNQSVISFDNPINHAEAMSAIMAFGTHITMLIQGEPGCGKTQILRNLEKQYGNKYHYVYVDCPMKDIGDIAANIPVHQTKSLEQYISSLFPKDGKPIIVMLDEILKSNKLLKLMFTRLMLERTIGDWPLPENSIVFATSNNSSDGLGDSVEGHVGNRISIVPFQKPTAPEWLLHATDNKWASEVRAWVHMNPSCLYSYKDGGQDDNPYIFNPKKGMVSYVSPRSLEKAAYIISKQGAVTQNCLTSLLAGTVGQSAAKSMAAFLSLKNEIVFTADVIKDPMGVRVPEKPAALFMMMFNALDELVTQDDLSAFMQFMDRTGSRELEGVFFTLLIQNKRTVKIAKGNKRVIDWASRNIELF